jgi:hypothetical protein
MSESEEDLRESARMREKEADKDEVKNKTQHYSPFIAWEDKGILYDLNRWHGRNKPSRDLLLSIAMGVAAQCGLTIGREEKRRKSFLIGWINEHYDCFRDVIENLVLGDTTGSLSGPVEQLKQYREEHPEDEEVARAVRDADFADCALAVHH